MPRELFLRAKKTPAVKTWVRSLEEPVRKFLVDRRVAREEAEASVEDSSDSTEDEEIVFVGRNGTMRDGWKKARREDKKQGSTEEGMVFNALGDDDESSAFKYVHPPLRALLHCQTTRKPMRPHRVKMRLCVDFFHPDDPIHCCSVLPVPFTDLSTSRRWLTHSISDYYGLDSRSVLVGNPSRKVVYVAPRPTKAGHAPPVLASLPRPLWQLCS